MMMKRRMMGWLLGATLLMTSTAYAAEGAGMAPDVLIKQVTTDVMNEVKADKAIQSGDLRGVTQLVDSKILPYINFQRMTASAAGPAWRQATPEQKQQLQEEFKTLLVKTYSGALAQVRDQKLEMRPLRAKEQDTEVTVRSLIKGGSPE